MTTNNDSYCSEHARPKVCDICLVTQMAQLIYEWEDNPTSYSDLPVEHQRTRIRQARHVITGLRKQNVIPKRQWIIETTAEEKTEAPTTQQVLLTLARKVIEQAEITDNKSEGLAYLNVYANIRETVDEIDEFERTGKVGED